MRRKVWRGIFITSTGPAALTVADAPLSPSNPLSPTTVGPSAASIRARIRSPPVGTLLLTSTIPEVRINRLPGSPPSSMIFSPGPKAAVSELSANSSRSSSVRNSKNLTPCSLSSTITTALDVFLQSPWADYMPALTSTKHGVAGDTHERERTGAALAPPRKRSSRSGLGSRLNQHLYVHDVGARRGQPDVLGCHLREIQVPPRDIRPPVGDPDHRAVHVADLEYRPHRQVRMGRRVVVVGVEDLATGG